MKLIRITAIFLFAVIIASLTSVFVFSHDLDYSYESAPLKTHVYAGDIIEQNLGIKIGDAEKQYLISHGGFSVSFNSHIPTTSVAVEYDYEHGVLKVDCEEYKYTAANGVEVIWKPVSVTLASDTKMLSAPNYITTFYDVSEDGGECVDVKFETYFVIPMDTVNEILNLAYVNAPLYKTEIEDKTAEYETKKAQYILDLSKYEAYIAALNAYTEYLTEKRIYDEKYAEYTQYLEDVEIYKIDKIKYEEYLTAKEKYLEDYALYLDYLAYVSVNKNQIEAYEKYVVNIEIAKAQLAIIKGTQRNATSLERSVYAAIMGDTVTSVIENKDAIANNLTGADPKVIDLAGAATQNLRQLYNGFFAIKDENEQYNYYVTNYEGFRDNFVALFQTLDKLYLNPKVRGVLKAQEKQEKYLILLAELFYTANALSDNPIKNYDKTAYYDSSYIIGKGYIDEKSPIKIMEGEEYIKDTNSATPLPEGYPIAVPKPEYTEKMEEPLIPTTVSSPTKPEEVAEPTAPVPVSAPEKVDKPGSAPIEYIPDPELVELVKAYDAGLITEREEYTSDLTYIHELTVAKKYKNVSSVTAVFYDKEYSDKQNAEILYSITVDKGTAVDYPHTAPEKREDSRYTYVHDYWSDAFGRAVDLSNITADIELYPTFIGIEKEYTTVWTVDGAVYTSEPESPQKSPTDVFYYTFTGWDEIWDAETATLTKNARFDERYVMETSYGGAVIEYGDSNITASVGSFWGPYDLSNLIELASGKYSITFKSSKGTLEFSYAETVALKKAGVTTLDFAVMRLSDGEYRYEFNLYGKDGEIISSPIKANMTAPCLTDAPERILLITEDGDGKKQVKRTANGSYMSFSAQSGTEYYTKLDYNISFVSLGEVTISVDKTEAKKGNRINISVSAPNGIRIDRVYFIDSGGTKNDITGSNFVMPGDDITIGVDYTIEEYVITFVSDDKTIATFICRYGDTVTPPNDPQKAGTDNFSYTFIGWSEDVVPVVGNAVYTAVYSRSVINTDKNDTGLQITPSVMRIILLAGSLAAVLLLIILPSSVMTIIVFKHRKNKLKIKSR